MQLSVRCKIVDTGWSNLKKKMDKITFKCKLSGNTVSFVNPFDIECLRKDVNYEEVKNGNQTETESKSTSNHAGENEARNERQERNDENEVRQEEVLIAQKLVIDRLLPAKEVKKKAGRPKKK